MTERRRELWGRAVEVRRSGTEWELQLLSGDQNQLLMLPAGVGTPRLGDWLRLELQSGQVVAWERVGGLESGDWPDDGGDALRWRRPGEETSRMAVLRRRQLAVRAVRDYLFEEGFLEIPSPLLVRGTTPDLEIDSIAVDDRVLITSTEYQLKRLEVAGFEKIYSLTQNFRAGEFGPRHNPEFTMLEWARVFQPLEVIERDAEALTRAAFRALHPDGRSLRFDGRSVELDGRPWERLTVQEGFARHLGLEIAPPFELEVIRREVERKNFQVPPAFLGDRHLLLSFLLDRLGGHMGSPLPTFLREWPAFMTSSAALKPGVAEVAERSELFLAGLEVADGFPSVRGAAAQAAMFEAAQRSREEEGKARVALDPHYLEALRLGMPPGAGMALGVDRLVMILTEQEEIRRVLPFAWDEL